jgi:copper chaperone CopZ
LERVSLISPDISCGHCVASVEGAVCALPGIESVTADAETKQVDVVFDPTQVALPQIKSVLAEVGYPVAP